MVTIRNFAKDWPLLVATLIATFIFVSLTTDFQNGVLATFGFGIMAIAYVWLWVSRLSTESMSAMLLLGCGFVIVMTAKIYSDFILFDSALEYGGLGIAPLLAFLLILYLYIFNLEGLIDLLTRKWVEQRAAEGERAKKSRI